MEWSNLFVYFFDHRRKGEFKKARLMYEKTIRLDPMYGDPYSSFAVLCEKLGDLKKAEELYKMAMMLNPDSPPECNNYGVFLARIGLFKSHGGGERRGGGERGGL